MLRNFVFYGIWRSKKWGKAKFSLEKSNIWADRLTFVDKSEV